MILQQQCIRRNYTVISLRTERAAPMPVAQEYSKKRKARPLKGQVAPPPEGELGKIEVGFLIPLMLATNIIVAIVVWYVVESLLR
jgi:hypothetical protein